MNPSRIQRPILDSEPASQPRLVRRLGAHERLLHHYSAAHPRHFCVVAELTANGGPRDYRAAFALIQRRHPMLSVLVGATEDGPGFYRAGRSLDVTVIPGAPESDWRRVVERELATGFSDAAGPLLRVTVLERDESAAVIVLTFHHAAADALSGAYVIQDLMEALDGRVLAPLPVLPPLEMLARKALLRPGEVIAVKQPAHGEVEALRAVARAALWRPFEGDRPAVSTIHFDPETTSRILQACRAHATTLHGALCAAVVLSATATRDEPANRDDFAITSAINLRGMLGVGTRNCALLVGVGTVRFSLRRDLEFWPLARQATGDLAPARAPEGVLAGIGALESRLPPQADGALASGLIGALHYDAIVSNLGAIPIPTRVGSVQLDAFWGPFVQGRFINERVIGAASVDGRLRITQTAPRHIPSFLDAFRRSLLAACIDA